MKHSFVHHCLLAPSWCQALSLVLGQAILTRCMAEGIVLAEGAACVGTGRVQNTHGITNGMKWEQEFGQGGDVRVWCYSDRRVPGQVGSLGTDLGT